MLMTHGSLLLLLTQPSRAAPPPAAADSRFASFSDRSVQNLCHAKSVYIGTVTGASTSLLGSGASAAVYTALTLDVHRPIRGAGAREVVWTPGGRWDGGISEPPVGYPRHTVGSTYLIATSPTSEAFGPFPRGHPILLAVVTLDSNAVLPPLRELRDELDDVCERHPGVAPAD